MPGDTPPPAAAGSMSPASKPTSPKSPKAAASPESKPTSPKSAASPKSKPTSPKSTASTRSKTASPDPGSDPGSPEASAVSPEPSANPEILPAQHWVDAAEGIDNSDAESIRSNIASSTASLSASILAYRKVHGRTYHHEIGNANYWASNDEQQNESMDILHHVQTLLLGERLFLAPLDTDSIHKVLDIGTGTGSWAIDFADDHPNLEVIGTDVSPIQSPWVPPNLKFEIEDCTLDWTFPYGSIDYVHIRFLLGSIADWEAVFKQAFQALAPGGWLESLEAAGRYESDDGTLKDESALDQWGKIFYIFGESIGRPFDLLFKGVQRKAMEAAGFVEIQEVDHKTPLGTWPKDARLKEVGEYVQLAMEADMEGYVLYPATSLGWSRDEVTVYTAHVRNEMRNPDIHPFYRQKTVYGRKPLASVE